MPVKLTDKVYNEGGSPVQGAVAQAILTNGTSTAVQDTDTSDANGIWAFDSGIAGHRADLPDPATGYWYDVRINVGMQYRLRYGGIKAMMNMVYAAQSIVIAAGQQIDTSLAALRVPARTSDPTSPGAGQIAFRTDTKEFRAYDGSTWWSVAGLPAGALVPYAGVGAAPQGFLLCDGSAVSRATYARLFAAVSTTYGAGDGSTTFNVPNLMGRVPVGAGTGAGLTARVLGAAGGEELHVLVTGELSAHNHAITDPTHNHAENSHNHTVTDPQHNHAGVSHNHTQNSHTHNATDGGAPLVMTGSPGSLFFELGHSNAYGGLAGTVAGNQAATQDVNNHATGISVDPNAGQVLVSSTGIQTVNSGSGTGHNTMQPFLVTSYLVKT